MKDDRGSPVGVGVLTVLTVLLVLTLAVFSALTYTSARADWALSRINADTVTAYYAADAEAARLLSGFSAGSAEELEATLPMTEAQSLRIHLARRADGTVAVLAWQTVPAQGEDAPAEADPLPVFDGTLPAGGFPGPRRTTRRSGSYAPD